ncbi:MAG: selenocysteine-specific translation elongation factor [Dehalococcoidia bacterium]|nr:selenocysteine-specific translation elongation factor [Dehalococcoidia bacterium]
MPTIGTAGHVDHGKSALVEALTGTHPDRLREEQERGLTIELGFAWCTLPSGREVSIVDVPGHVRFVRHMLAGAGAIDLALFVVAADEGVMPQTREHLEILDLLDIRHAVVALTKCDLVDDPDWLDLVEEEVRLLLEPTTLRGAPIVRVSAHTHAGLDDLRAAIDTALDAVPPPRDIGRPRLGIDRVFTMSGFGTVVTGTLLDGRLHVGDTLEAVPGGPAAARVRGLQSHRRDTAEALPGTRTAVNLAGIDRDDLRRGQVLAPPGRIPAARTLDARVRVLDHRPLRHNLRVALHIGSDEVQARVRVLGVIDERGDPDGVESSTSGSHPGPSTGSGRTGDTPPLLEPVHPSSVRGEPTRSSVPGEPPPSSVRGEPVEPPGTPSAGSNRPAPPSSSVPGDPPPSSVRGEPGEPHRATPESPNRAAPPPPSVRPETPQSTVEAHAVIAGRASSTAGSRRGGSPGSPRTDDGSPVRPPTLDAIPPDAEGWVQLVLTEPVAAVPGELFVLRVSDETIAGGRIIEVNAPRHRRTDPATVERLAARAEGTPESRLLAALERAEPCLPPALRATVEVDAATFDAALASLLEQGDARALEGGLLLSAAGLARLQDRARRALHAYHEAHPLRVAMPREELRVPLALEQREYAAILPAVVAGAAIEERPAGLALAGWEPRPTAAQRRAADDATRALEAGGVAPPRLDLDAELLAYLAGSGRVVDCGDGVVLAAPAFETARTAVIGALRGREGATLAELRDALGTNRRAAQAILETMDRLGVTRREGEGRVLGPAASA